LQTEDEAQPPPLWQLLVTDGHVQAARIRAVQPWLTSIGIGLILIGALLQFVIPAPVLRSRDQLVQQEYDALYAPVRTLVLGLPSERVATRDYNKLVPAAEIPAVAAAIEDALNASWKLPHDRLTLVEVSPTTFWLEPWPFFSLISTGNDDLKLVGAAVNVSTPSEPKLRRWIGIFQQKNGRWRHVSLGIPEYFAPAPSASFADVALDLKPLLPPGY